MGLASGESDGVVAAVAATMLHGLAVVMQKSQAKRASARGIRILATLARRPIWLLAIGIQMIGVGLQGLAAAQNALETHRANTVVPCLVAVQVLVPIAMAHAVHAQDVRVASPAALVVAALATATGLLTLCTSPRGTAEIATPT